MGVDVWLVYVRTKDNLRADPASRKPLQSEWHKQLDLWRKNTGKEPRKIKMPEELRSTHTWTRTGKADSIEARMKDVFVKILAILDFYEEHNAQHKLRIPIDVARNRVQMLLDDEPVPMLDRSLSDFPEVYEPSPARLLLSPIDSKVITESRSVLERRVKQNQEVENKLRARANLGNHVHLQEVLNVIMQQQSDARSVLWEVSTEFCKDKPAVPKDVKLTPVLSDLGSSIEYAERWLGIGSLASSVEDSGAGALGTWIWGPTATQADMTAILSSFNSATTNSKHCESWTLPSKQATFNKLCELFGYAVEYGGCQLRVMSSGSLSAMCDEVGNAQFTRKQLREARQSIKRDLEFLLRNSDRDAESNPFRRAAAVTSCLPLVSIEAECAFPDGNTGFATVPDTSNTMGIFNLPQCIEGRESRMEDFKGNSWENVLQVRERSRNCQARG